MGNSQNIIKRPLIYRISSKPYLKWGMILIPLTYLMVILYYSIFNVLKLSVFDESGFTLTYITETFTEPIYLKVLWTTFKTAVLVTILTLIVAYPICYLITILRTNKIKRLILGIVIITLWISLLARTFSWVLVFQKEGIINNLLLSIGIISEPIEILYSVPAVVIGMSHILLPFMVLNLYPVMEGIDLGLIQAGKSLGARPFRAFINIFLPLSLPGIISGSVIVFVNSLGYFITPALLGGINNMMIAQLIEININKTFNWNLAAAISVLLILSTFLFLFLATLLTKRIMPMKGAD